MGCSASRFKQHHSRLTTTDFSAESWDSPAMGGHELDGAERPKPMTMSEIKRDIEKRVRIAQREHTAADYTLYEVPLYMTEIDYSNRSHRHRRKLETENTE